jgi:hypothetical protein
MKKKVSRVSTQINVNDFQSTGNLPTPESVDNFAASLTSKEPLTERIKTETLKLEMAAGFKTYGRPVKEKAVGREAFTTAIHTDFIMMLKSRALKRGCTVADLLDTVLSDHLSKY